MSPSPDKNISIGAFCITVDFVFKNSHFPQYLLLVIICMVMVRERLWFWQINHG